jgi:hypothetical protein
MGKTKLKKKEKRGRLPIRSPANKANQAIIMRIKKQKINKMKIITLQILC